MMKNTVFDYDKKEIIGLVNSVDTGMSTAVINDEPVPIVICFG